MSSASVLALSVVGTAGGAYWSYRGFRLFERRRRLLNTPRSKISSASPGLVEVSGLATGPAVITSPLGQVECFYYRSLAWEFRRRGKNRGWVKIADECLHVPFYIDDGTGRLLVDTRGAVMDIDCDLKQELGRSPLHRDPRMRRGAGQFLSRHGANFSRRLRVKEFSIQPKSVLFVLGTLAKNPVTNPGSRVIPAGRVSESKAAVASGPGGEGPSRSAASPSASDREIVYLSPDATPQSAAEMTTQQRVASALMKAGISNRATWERAGVNAPNPVEASRYLAPAAERAQEAAGRKAGTGPVSGDLDPHPPVVLMKGTHDSPFLISSRSRLDLARSLGWEPALVIWGGPVLTLLGLSILLAYFHGW